MTPKKVGFLRSSEVFWGPLKAQTPSGVDIQMVLDLLV